MFFLWCDGVVFFEGVDRFFLFLFVLFVGQVARGCEFVWYAEVEEEDEVGDIGFDDVVWCFVVDGSFVVGWLAFLFDLLMCLVIVDFRFWYGGEFMDMLCE